MKRLNSYQKHKLKEWAKKKKAWFIASGLFLVVGGVLCLVGMYMTGFSFIAWLKSPLFVTFIVIMLVGILTCGYVIISLIRHQLGGHDDE